MEGETDTANYMRKYRLSVYILATDGLSQMVSISDSGFESPPEDGHSDCGLGQFCDSTSRHLYAWYNHLQTQKMFYITLGV
jgi:hypothetical protein